MEDYKNKVDIGTALKFLIEKSGVDLLADNRRFELNYYRIAEAMGRRFYHFASDGMPTFYIDEVKEPKLFDIMEYENCDRIIIGRSWDIERKKNVYAILTVTPKLALEQGQMITLMRNDFPDVEIPLPAGFATMFSS